jgi:hypothetical protein
VTSHGSGARPLVLVFGLQDAPVRWLTHQLRGSGVVATSLGAEVAMTAAQAVCAAADAGVHLFNAGQGMDGRFWEIWQLLAEAGKPRFLLIHDLGPATLDVNEAAAIASRVLEEDVLTASLPLLDDEEQVIGVLDVATGEQVFPDGTLQGPRDDFSEAVEAETNTLYEAADAVGVGPEEAIRDGSLSVAATLDTVSAAGVAWLVSHLPSRSTPIATTVLPGDDPQVVLVAAGPQGCSVGPALAVIGGRSQPVNVVSMADLFATDLPTALPPGAVAAARCTPVPQVGSWLVSASLHAPTRAADQ